SPNGDPDGASTAFYNQYFGVSRFQNRGYYGGHFGSNNDNWYDLFSASGMDFIVISFEFDPTHDADVLAWADQLLTTYSNRRAHLFAVARPLRGRRRLQQSVHAQLPDVDRSDLPGSRQRNPGLGLDRLLRLERARLEHPVRVVRGRERWKHHDDRSHLGVQHG